MSSEVAATIAASPQQEPFQESFFEEEWKKCIGGDALGGLDAIAEFNASFDNSAVGNDGGIDPQLLNELSRPAKHNVAASISDQKRGSPEATFNSYPDVLPSLPNTPYFHQSIEMPQPPPMQQYLYQPSPLSHQLHRRSVSEPPAGLLDHNFPRQPPQPVLPTFYREGYTIGTPKRQYQPAGDRASRPAARTRGQNRQQPYPNSKPAQERTEPRRSQTQPMHPGMMPTSVPSAYHMHTPPPQQMMLSSAAPSPPTYVSSRVCTPAPSPEPVSIRFNVDPAPASPTPVQTHQGEKKTAVAVPLDELRALITEAVQKAIQSGQSVKSFTQVGESATNGGASKSRSDTEDTASKVVAKTEEI